MATFFAKMLSLSQASARTLPIEARTNAGPATRDRRPIAPAPVAHEVVALSALGGILELDLDGRLTLSPCGFPAVPGTVWHYDGTCLHYAGDVNGAPTSVWEVHPAGGRAVAFRTAGGSFVKGSPALGPVSQDAPEPLAWESFRLLSLDDYQLVALCAAARWVIGDDARPTRPNSLTFREGFQIEFGGRLVPLDDFLVAVRGGLDGTSAVRPPMTFTFFHGTCTPAKAVLFNPLIYSTASGPPHFFEQYAMSCASFETYGRYEGAYRVICDRDRQDVSSYLGAIADERWDCIRRPLNDVEALVVARMKVLKGNDFDGFQPILYVDCDVICDCPIEGLLVAALRSDRILIATEFPGLSIGEVGKPHGNWFGLFLYDQEPQVNRHRCINNGVFAAKNRDVFIAPFAAIEESRRRYQDLHADAHKAAYDQPFYSYVLQYLDVADFQTMNSWVHNLQGLEPSDTYEPVGLAHFNIGVGMDKTAAMQRYVSLLKSHDEAWTARRSNQLMQLFDVSKALQEGNMDSKHG